MDYHVHSSHSSDGRSTIFEMCQKAVELGIAEIGFSEHMDFEPKDWGFGFFNYDSYTPDIKSVQESFKSKLIVRKGIEIDYQYCYEDRIEEWLQDKEFDFVIGSVHYVDHEIITRQSVVKKDLRELYHAYFNEVTRSIESGFFDVIGHLDLVRRYVDNRSLELKRFNYLENIKAILKEIIDKKLYLEINSKGLREEYRDTTPSKEIINEFIKNGGKLLSIGSDAHTTEEIGGGIEEIQSFLRNYDKNHLKLLFE